MAHGFTVEGGLGAGASVIPHKSSAHSVLVPDTELLFNAQFHRAGPDLVLTGRDGQHHLIPGYFSSEHHPALVAPNGAHLSPDTVDLLAGSATPGHYAQAQPTPPPDAIGKVEKVVGDVTVVRNGVAVALHVGDAVLQSDVVQTAASSSCGISFPDGTAINLVANTRMALNDYAYDANSNANGALFTLVEGTFAFVAGKVAHSGDMKIATPVATMGIRGTTGVVQEQPQTPATITATAADRTYTFAVTPDFGTGITGMWDVFLTDANGNIVRDANGNPIVLVTVSQSGYVTYVTPQGPGQPPLVTTEPVTSAQYAFEQDLLHQLAQTLNLGNQQNNGNNGSSTPPPQELPNTSPQLQETPPTPIKINDVPDLAGSASTPPTEIFGSPPPIIPPSNVAIWSSSSSGDWDTAPDWNIKSVPGEPKFVEILSQVTVTISEPESASGLELAAAAVLIIIAGGSLTIANVIDNAGLIELSSLNSASTLAVDGIVLLQGGGQIEMLGPATDNMIVGIPNTGATLVNVDNTISGSGTIGGNLTLKNFGVINANGEIVVNTGNEVINGGLLESTSGGTLVLDDNVANSGGMIAASGNGSLVEINAVTISGGSLETNSGGSIQVVGGASIFDDLTITSGSEVQVNDGSSLTLEGKIDSSGVLTIVGGANLFLAGATVTGGMITDDGTIHVTANSAIDGNAVVDGDVGVLTVDSGVTLTLDDATLENLNVTNGGALQVDGGDTLTLTKVSIAGGMITDDGTIDVTGNSTIDGNAVVDGDVGGLTVDGGVTLTLDDATLENLNVNNSGTLEVLAGGVLALNSDQIANAGGTIQADATAQLTLNGSTVSNGTVTNYGTLDLTGNDKIQTGVLTNTAILDVSGADNEIDNETAFTNSGTLEVLAGGVLALNSDQIANAGGTIQADATAQLTLNGSTVSNGTVTNYGTLDLTGNDKIQTGVLTNTAILDVSGAGNEIDNETAFTNSGTLEVLAGGVLALNSDQIANAGGTIQADATAQLTLNGSTVSNGTVTNYGTLDLTGNDKIQTGVLTNTAILDVSGAGNEIDNETAFTNSGTLEVLAGGVLALNSDQIANAGGTIQADATAQLTLNGTTVSNGTVTNHGTLDLTGNDKIQTGTLTNTAILDVSGAGNEIDNETAFTNSGTLEVLAGGVLALNSDQIANAGGTIQADATAQLTLNGSTVSNGTVTNYGTLDLTGNDKIQTGVLTNTAILDVSGAGNEIDNETAFTNSGTLEVLAGGVLALNSDQIANAGGTIQADATAQLTLNDTTVSNGTVTNHGTLDLTGNDKIQTGVLTNTAILDVSGAGNEIDNETAFTNSGTLEVLAGGVLALNSDQIANAGGTIQADATAQLTLNGSTVSNGTVTNHGTLDLTGNDKIQTGVLTNTAILDVSGAGNEIDNETAFTNSGTLEVLAGACWRSTAIRSPMPAAPSRPTPPPS